MNTKEKLYFLEKSMELRKRDNGEGFYCFTDNAPKELQGLFLKHFEVRDLDYQIFSCAIDTFIEAWNNNEESPTLLQDYIDDNYNDFSSPYNADRLAYLNIWNDEEIAQIFKNYDCETISMACAYWYDNQVKDAISIISDWVTDEK